MAKYRASSIRRLHRYQVRRDRMKIGLREANTGREFRPDDQAVMLATVIRLKDPKHRKAFTPEVAEKLL